MEHPSDDGDARYRILLSALLTAIIAGAITDFWMDLPDSPGTIHIALEGMLVLLSLCAVAYLWAGWMRVRSSLARAHRDSETHRRERDAWHKRARTFLRGLGEEIDRQFRQWRLTPTERETALFLLKGYGHKEIALLLEKSERTVRQQAVSVYRKSGLSGRAELAAFFLEDLLLPSPDRGVAAELADSTSAGTALSSEGTEK